MGNLKRRATGVMPVITEALRGVLALASIVIQPRCIAPAPVKAIPVLYVTVRSGNECQENQRALSTSLRRMRSGFRAVEV